METNITKEQLNQAIFNESMAKDIQYIKEAVDAINDKLESDYVKTIEFEPVKKVVFGLVALILVAVVRALLSATIK